MENKRKEAQQLLVSCVFFLFASTCDQLFTNRFFFILSREHCFFLFIFLGATSVVRSSSFFFGYWGSLFFHCAFTCFLVFSYRAFCSWGAEVIHCFFATSVDGSCWRWISCFMGIDATCVFFVAHRLPRLILGSWCCSFVLQVLCVVNVIQPLPMLLVCGASIDYVCCRCYLSTSNIILCATSAINVTLALPMVFRVSSSIRGAHMLSMMLGHC